MRTLPPCGVLLLTILKIVHGTTSDVTTYDQRQTGDLNIHVSVKDMRIIALLGGGIGGLEDYDYNYDYAELTVKPINATTTAATTTTKIIEEENIDATTEKIVEITPSHSVLHSKPNSSIPNKPLAISLNEHGVINSQKPSLTIIHKPNNVSINKPSLLDNKINGSQLFGNKNKTQVSEKPSNGKPSDSEIPVKVLVTPVEILHNNHEENNTSSKPDASTIIPTKKIRQADCIEGYRKDRRGVCRPKARRPTQPSLLKQIIQLSRRVQAAKQQ